MAAPLSLFYLVYLGALGLWWPYLSLYLDSLGLGSAENTAILACSPLAGLIVPPLCGLAADARRARVWILRAACAGAAVAFCGLLQRDVDRSALWITFILFAIFRAPITALSDAAAVDHVRRHGGSYGRLRLWGSLGFLVAVTVGGLCFDRYGLRAMLFATVAGLSVTAVAAWFIPAPPTSPRAPIFSAWSEMLRERGLWLFLAAVSVAQVSSAVYDACFSLHLARLGYSQRFIGAAWGLGVFSEVFLLALSAKLLARIGAERLFGISIAIAAVRWMLTARAGSPTAFLAIAPLHGITFGTFYASAVTITRERARPETPTAAQGLFAAALGLGSFAGMLLAGQILDRFGGRTLFAVAAGFSAAGAGFAWLFSQRAPRALPREEALTG